MTDKAKTDDVREAVAAALGKRRGHPEPWTSDYYDADAAMEAFALITPAPAGIAGEDSPITAAIRAKLAKVKATTYRAGTPAERMKDGKLDGLNTALAIAMVEDEQAALSAAEPAPVARPLALGGQHSTAHGLSEDDVDQLLACTHPDDPTHAQDEGAAGEPVAWRKRPSGQHPLFRGDFTGVEWRVSVAKPDLGEGSQPEWFDIQPLYAHPSPTPAADADRVRIAVEALEPFVPVWAKLTGLSDGIDVRLDASFALQDATGRARGATCNPNLPKLTVGDFRKAHKALAALKSTAAKEGGE